MGCSYTAGKSDWKSQGEKSWAEAGCQGHWGMQVARISHLNLPQCLWLPDIVHGNRHQWRLTRISKRGSIGPNGPKGKEAQP